MTHDGVVTGEALAAGGGGPLDVDVVAAGGRGGRGHLLVSAEAATQLKCDRNRQRQMLRETENGRSY